MVFNERVGLPSSFVRKPGVMREEYNMLISIQYRGSRASPGGRDLRSVADARSLMLKIKTRPLRASAFATSNAEL